VAHLFRPAIINYPGDTMKGPYERLKYDLRRLWECPSCKRRERSGGTVTTRFCTCREKGVGEGKRTAMKLLEEAGHREVPEIKYVPAADISASDAAEGDRPLPVEISPNTEPPANS
jgi:hypothetical protein